MRRHIAIIVVSLGLSSLPAWAGGFSFPGPVLVETRARLVGTALSATQLLIWDGVAGEYALLRQGGSLAGGRIASIIGDRVVVERPSGSDGRLVFELEAPSAANTVAPVAAASPALVSAPLSAPAALPGQTVPQVAGANVFPVVPPASIPASMTADEGEMRLDGRVFHQQIEDFNGIAQFVGVAPAESGGYRVTLLKRGGYLESLGLRDGDVVKKIDGRPLNSSDDAAHAYAWLRVTDHFSVEVVRDGAVLLLKYRLVAKNNYWVQVRRQAQLPEVVSA